MKQNVHPRINCAPDMAKKAPPHSDTILKDCLIRIKGVDVIFDKKFSAI